MCVLYVICSEKRRRAGAPDLSREGETRRRGTMRQTSGGGNRDDVNDYEYKYFRFA